MKSVAEMLSGIRYNRLAGMAYLTCSALMFFGCTAKNTEELMIDIPAATPVATLEAIIERAEPTPTPTLSAGESVAPSFTPDVTAAPKAEEDDTGKTYPVQDQSFYYQALDKGLKERITGMSYPSDGEECRIKYDDLRYIGIHYYDFEGGEHTGELIVNRKLAKEVVEIFYELYKNKYPLASVRLVDDYGEPGDDNVSMAANNSSAFNYRRVSGSKKLSRHSYGAAIDINPLYNPYIDGDRVAPPEGAAYVDREKAFPGKIDHDDLCYMLFIQHGWSWGGDWSGDKDYQHFSKDIDY